MFPCSACNFDVVKFLIEAGSDLGHTNDTGWNVLMMCPRGFDGLMIVNLLLDHVPDIISNVTVTGHSVLHIFA